MGAGTVRPINGVAVYIVKDLATPANFVTIQCCHLISPALKSGLIGGWLIVVSPWEKKITTKGVVVKSSRAKKSQSPGLNFELDIRNLSPGLYQLHVKDVDGKSGMNAIIVE